MTNDEACRLQLKCKLGAYCTLYSIVRDKFHYILTPTT